MKLEFGGPTGTVSSFLSLRASAHTGVAIPRIDVPPLVEEFQKTAQKNGLYDDMQPEIRWRLPHQRARWFAMTVLFDALAALCKFQFVSVFTKVDNRIDNYGSAQRRLDVSNFPEMGPGYAGNLSKHRETLNTLADCIRAGNQKEQTHAG